MGLKGRRDIENRVVDPCLVQHVFGPAVVDTRHGAEQIFHRQGGTSPMMSFELGYGNNPINLLEDFRKGESGQPGLTALIGDGLPSFIIEVDEGDSVFKENLA